MKATHQLHDLRQTHAADLQSQGTHAFDESWSKLLDAIEAKGNVLQGSPKF